MSLMSVSNGGVRWERSGTQANKIIIEKLMAQLNNKLCTYHFRMDFQHLGLVQQHWCQACQQPDYQPWVWTVCQLNCSDFYPHCYHWRNWRWNQNAVVASVSGVFSSASQCPACLWQQFHLLPTEESCHFQGIPLTCGQREEAYMSYWILNISGEQMQNLLTEGKKKGARQQTTHNDIANYIAN